MSSISKHQRSYANVVKSSALITAAQDTVHYARTREGRLVTYNEYQRLYRAHGLVAFDLTETRHLQASYDRQIARLRRLYAQVV